jgi:O-acetylserine/cysteine efflux transporter
MKPFDACLAVLVAVIWGLAFVASRIALDEFSPELMTVTAVDGLAVMLLSRRPQALPKIA